MPMATKKKRAVTSADPFPPFPHAYVTTPIDFDSTASLEPWFSELESRNLDSAAALEKWIHDWSELGSILSEEESRRYIDHTCHTGDPAVEKRYMDFQNTVNPFVKPRWQNLKKKYAASLFRMKLDAKRYEVFDRTVRNEIELFRAENVPLETQDAEMVVEWQKVSGAMTVPFDGKELTLPQMGRILEETDRTRREKAWRAMSKRRLQDRDGIDAIYGRMVANRHRRALNAGFKNFRDYIFREKSRFDYTPDDCRRYHDAVQELIVPVLRKLHGVRRERLKVDVLRPWDIAVDPEGAAPLRPFKDVKGLFNGVRDIYRKVSPDLAKLLEAIRDRGNLDLESRKGKAPGGYMSPLDDQRVPFIFMNAAGVHRDVMTLLHEGGHALHTIFARREPILMYRMAPLEFCEVASMGMEAIGIKHIDVFYGKKEAERARHNFFEDMFKIFPWIATIDAFQHEVYLAPDMTAKDRHATWVRQRARFKGGDDWTGLEAEHATSWHAQMHPFCVPFYYIEYAIAQIGALQVWMNARKDRKRALELYRRGLSLGGSRPLPELFKSAGCRFGLDSKTLKPLVKAITAEL